MTEVHVHIGSVPTLNWIVSTGELVDSDPASVYLIKPDPPAPSPHILVSPARLTPVEARKLAVLLCQAADRADGYPPMVRDVPRSQIARKVEPVGPQPARPDHIEAAERGLL